MSRLVYCVEVSPRPGVVDARGARILKQVQALGVAGVSAVSVADLYFLLMTRLEETGAGEDSGAGRSRVGAHGQGDNPEAEDVQRLVEVLLHDPVAEQATWHRLPDAGSSPSSSGGRDHQAGVGGSEKTWAVEVTLLPGVTDSVAESLLEGARLIGVRSLEQAATGQRYVITGDLDESLVHRIASHLLANDVIQRVTVNRPAQPFSLLPQRLASAEPDSQFTGALNEPWARPLAQHGSDPFGGQVELISISELDPAGLLSLSQERRLSLDLAEMQAIQDYYRRLTACKNPRSQQIRARSSGAPRMPDPGSSPGGREPTDVELETLAQTWSEHCVHKSFKALITYTELGPDGSIQEHQIDSILKTYIRAATEHAEKPWLRSAFVDNAGIVAFDEHFDLAFKVETHNHPSALEPFGGANTGVGGVVRDVIGVSARPIANSNILCFGPQDLSFDELPLGVLHPRRISDGVIAGIEDYGNKMGIPTVSGAIFYDSGYTANPLVFCGCLGMLPCGSHPTQPKAGDLVVVIGGRTGRDGLRGATFSSMEMDHETGEVAGSAVQIGHPIHEKQLLEAVMQARDEGLYSAITDCGAGGLSSAVGEMGSELGAEVHLQRVPIKYPGLRPWEIWLSEAQERMVLAVPPEHWPRLQEICAEHDVEATDLGHFTGDGSLRVLYGGQVVGELEMGFLHGGIPRRHLRAEWTPPPQAVEETQGSVVDATHALLTLLARPETRSKEDVIRQYDHEVQGATVVKPLVGHRSHGPSDATVLVPQEGVRKRLQSQAGGERIYPVNAEGCVPPPDKMPGAALSVGVNPHYGSIDPYLMAWACVDEALRNLVAVGADPDRVSLLDNFAWGNPNLPDRLGALVRCAQGCYDAAVAYGVPYISGKDSLNNEYTGVDGRKHAIPGTLVISALGVVPDVGRSVTMDVKRAGNWLYALGETRGEMGGASYTRSGFALRSQSAVLTRAPQPPERALALYRILHQAIMRGLVRSCHDCSEGGLAVAAAEMALAGGLGIELRLDAVPRSPELMHSPGGKLPHVVAFCESLGRFLVEVQPSASDAFEAMFAGLPVTRVGRVRADDQVLIWGLEDQGQMTSDPLGQPVRPESFISTHLPTIDEAWRGDPPSALALAQVANRVELEP